MTFSDKYKSFVATNAIYTPAANILVAVSGGRDSIALLHLVNEHAKKVAIAHVNYGLRPESEQETQLVQRVAKTLGLPLHLHRPSPPQEGQNIQQWARDIRFEWMNHLCEQNGFDVILTGAHQNDQAETILFNLARGAGLSGGRGMLPKQHNVGHPLLFAQRQQIDQYVKDQQLEFLDDSSNATSKYTRNFIRHQVLPGFEQIHPNAVQQLAQFAEKIRSAEKLVQETVDQHYQEGKFEMLTQDLLTLNPLVTEGILAKMGFDSEQTRQLLNTNVKVLKSENFKGYVNGDYWTFEPVNPTAFYTPYDLDRLACSTDILTEEIAIEDLKMTGTKSHAFLDLDKLEFPLHIRLWEAGDRFQPFGMRGTKTVGDFLTDEKVPVGKRDSIQIMTANGQIVWVVGHRIDQRFGMDKNTKKVYHCTYQPQP